MALLTLLIFKVRWLLQSRKLQSRNLAIPHF
jgi:hypothetical protein